MKLILAPVDFSNASRNALAFAAELAKRASARLVIATIIQKGDNESESRGKLTALELDIRKSFGHGLRLESLLAKGSLVPAIKKIIADHQPDLIVMGTKGASGLKRILIGSNTVKVIAKTKVPVLVIPEVAKFDNFLRKGKSRVVLATDLDAVDNDQATELLKTIALLMIEPKIRVLSVRPKNTRLDFNKGMERAALLSAFQPEIESERVTVFSRSVMSGLNFYLNKNKDTGLVAMIARNSGQLIERHFTREMASHTRFPLLVLHDKKR